MTASTGPRKKREWHPEFPRKCECGGRMKYERDFGRVFSYCLSCTPVSVVEIPPSILSPAPPPKPARKRK